MQAQRLSPAQKAAITRRARRLALTDDQIAAELAKPPMAVGLQRVYTKAHTRFGVTYPASETVYSVRVTKNASITIFEHDKTGALIERNTFKLGEQAEYGSYNLSYYGEIVAISDKAVTIKEPYSQARKHMLSLDKFCWRNAKWSLTKASADNSETMMYI